MPVFIQAQVNIIDQFVNPCGNDAQNEFIIFNTSVDINIANMALGSYDPLGPQNYNYWWYGSNTPSCPYNANFSVYPEACSSLSSTTFSFLYPSNSSNNTIINARINELNTIAGCTVFLAVPSTNVYQQIL